MFRSTLQSKHFLVRNPSPTLQLSKLGKSVVVSYSLVNCNFHSSSPFSFTNLQLCLLFWCKRELCTKTLARSIINFILTAPRVSPFLIVKQLFCVTGTLFPLVLCHYQSLRLHGCPFIFLACRSLMLGLLNSSILAASPN